MLKILNLYVSLEGKSILNGVNLTVKPGELHVLMGPNGSGKSTLGYVLMGKKEYKIKASHFTLSTSLRASRGKQNSKIKINDKNIINLSPDERAKLGLFLAFQTPIAIPGVSVDSFLRTVKKIDRKNINSLIKFNKNLEKICQFLSIDRKFLKRSLNDGFSGGEKKKLETLQMLVISPKYAIIDEIDTGLDVDALEVVAKGIKKLKKEKTGILLITHYQRILKYLKPDFVHVLIKGKIVKSGKADLAKKIEEKGYKNLSS